MPLSVATRIPSRDRVQRITPEGCCPNVHWLLTSSRVLHNRGRLRNYSLSAVYSGSRMYSLCSEDGLLQFSLGWFRRKFWLFGSSFSLGKLEERSFHGAWRTFPRGFLWIECETSFVIERRGFLYIWRKRQVGRELYVALISTLNAYLPLYLFDPYNKGYEHTILHLVLVTKVYGVPWYVFIYASLIPLVFLVVYAVAIHSAFYYILYFTMNFLLHLFSSTK